MPLHDIAHITKSIIRLIDARVKPALGVSTDVTLPVPPDKMTADGLSFFLFHIQENAHYKNMPPPGKDLPPVRFTPMALNLYYQLSPHHTREPADQEDIYKEQLMMSAAIKALHDFPEINVQTTVANPAGGAPLRIFEPTMLGKNNRIKISLLPITYNEAVQNWTAGTSPLRLAAYYEVSVVFLEPEVQQSYAGRVLQYGAFVFPGGAPCLTGSRNTFAYTLPDGVTEQQIVAQPAQAPPGSTFELSGSGFNGDRLELLLYARGKKYKATGWPVALKNDGLVEVSIQENAEEIFDNAPSVPNTPLTPGLYAAQLNIIRDRKLPNGEVRSFHQLSNQFPFSMVPRVDTVSEPVGGVVTVTGYRFRLLVNGSDVLRDDILVYIGEERVFRDAGFLAGEFRVTADNTLEINLPGGLIAGEKLPVRIIIGGAESPPNWITIP